MAVRLRQSPAEVEAATAQPPVFILIVPLFHVTGGVAVMLSCALAGAPLVMMYKWSPERALELIERERVTNFVGVPTQSWDLLESPSFSTRDTSSLVSVGVVSPGARARAPMPSEACWSDSGFHLGISAVASSDRHTPPFTVPT